MKRLRSIALWSLAVALATGCRSNLGGLPATGPVALAPNATTNQTPGAPKQPELTMPLTRVGSSNTITADPPVPRPDTKPCVVTLFYHYAFKNFSNKTFPYKPPADCPGPWAKVVFNFDVRVTKGIQYDRTGIIWVDGGVIYFGTTSEPSPNLAPHWHVARDVTDLSALFTKASTGQVSLWNCYCPPDYNGYQIGKAYLQFYPPDAKYPAPPVPDEVIGLPYSPPLGNVATLPHTPMEYAGYLPTNIVQAYADVFLQSQDKEEQWFMDVPDKVWRQSKHALGFSRGSAFREGVVTVDGQPAGLAPIYPWIYTGGMDPYLWFPIPGVQTLDFAPFRVNITPFAGQLSNGAAHTIDVRVFRAYDYFSGAGDLLLYLDPKQTSLTGSVTEDTLPKEPDLSITDTIAYGTGTGIFGGATAEGSVDTHSRNDYTISGYVNSSSGKITTTINGSAHFVNEQSFDYTSSRYVQLATQNTHFGTTITTQDGSHQTIETDSFEYPLDVSYPILAHGSELLNPVKVYQGFRADRSVSSGGPPLTTQISNTVKSVNTLIFNSSFEITGERNSSSLQLYTWAAKRPDVCYGEQIETKNNVVTAISEPGCTAKPPPRRRPRA
ncbi:MAG TPA: peptide-N4-asparagine amidase [Candidatus Babeliales bacterium]|nr:peptide-N4-asparagine amidase [Candidatus Babeliales bacterium]